MKKLKDILIEDCWKGYKQVGMKDKGSKKVPNCVPIEEQYITEDILDTLKNKFSKEKILQTLKDLKTKVSIEGAETKEAYDLLISGLQGNTLSDEDKKKISEQLKDLLKAVGLGAIAILPGGAIVMALLKLFKLQNFILPSAFKTPVT